MYKIKGIMLKFALLGLLRYRPLTGYALKRIMDESTANFWHADLSQIYKALKSLEQDGCIVSETDASPTNQPDRRIYSITDRGQQTLTDWLLTPMTETQPLKETLLLKVFFSSLIDPQTLLMQLRLQRELHQQTLTRFQTKTSDEIEAKRAFMNGTENDVLLWQATQRAGILYEEAYVRWLDETIQMIEARQR